MATLRLSTSLDMLRPLCCHRMHRLQEVLCGCLHEVSLQAHQAIVTLSACLVLQNSPQFIVQGAEVCNPWGPILGQKIPLQPLLSCLGLVGSCWVLLEDPFLTIQEGHVNVSQLLVACPLDILRYQFHPFLTKMKRYHPPPTKPLCRMGDGLSAPSDCFPSPHGMFEHKYCCSGSCTAPWWWRFSCLWRGCVCAHSWHATGEDALLLSAGSPSKWQ